MIATDKLPKSAKRQQPKGGSRKGKPNKATKALKDMILQALDEQTGGGVEYLKEQARSNPTAFLTLIGKVLPTTLAGDPNAPLLPATINVIAGA